MRIGVNALYLIPGGVGGTEIYLRSLLQALARVDQANEYFIFTNRETGSDLVPAAANFHHAPQPVNATFRPARLLYEQLRLPQWARRLRLDVMFNPGFTAPAFHSCPNVTVFHDLQHRRHPEYFRWWDLPFWECFLGLAVRNSEILVTVSAATMRDLQHFYGVPASRARVVQHGVENEFSEIARRRGQTEPYLLCVSTLHPHKNLERLVSVFARFRERHPEFRLVLAGMRGFHSKVLEQRIAELNVSESVTITGWIPREKLHSLFRRARAFVYPSTFEGFGMPVLEAMAAGVPLACSKIDPLMEIAADAAELFAPDNDQEMLEALERVIVAPARGQERAALFTWERAASKTLAALEEALDQGTKQKR